MISVSCRNHRHHAHLPVCRGRGCGRRPHRDPAPPQPAPEGCREPGWSLAVATTAAAAPSPSLLMLLLSLCQAVDSGGGSGGVHGGGDPEAGRENEFF